MRYVFGWRIAIGRSTITCDTLVPQNLTILAQTLIMKFKFPTAITFLFIICGLVTLMTWFVPAGSFDKLQYDSDAKSFVRVQGDEKETLPATQETLEALGVDVPLEKFTSGSIYKPIAIPDTYKKLKPSPQSITDFFKAPVRGIIASADIIFLVLVIGGLIGLMNQTGAFDAGMNWLAKKLKGREYLLIILVVSLIALGGTTFGLAEETMAFFPILIPVFIAARYDAMTGLASIFMGSAIGTMFSTINPFSVIIASDAAGINWTVGLTGRLILLLGALILTIGYIIYYAERVKKDPSKSVIFEDKERLENQYKSMVGNQTALTARMRLILVVFTLCFIIMIYGVSNLDWWFVEMSTTFIVGAIAIAIIGGIPEKKFIDSFIEGAGDLLGVAFIIGIARGVSVIMEDGLIGDTMLYYASSLTEGMNKGIFINVLMFMYSGLSFFIPSSSGMAVLTMPIFSPLAETVDIGREHIVNAYQYGPGLFFIINPTGLILASLAIVKLGYDKWLKFIMPLFILLAFYAVIGITVSVYMS